MAKEGRKDRLDAPAYEELRERIREEERACLRQVAAQLRRGVAPVPDEVPPPGPRPGFTEEQEARLTAYALGDLDADARQSVEAWLRGDPRARAFVAESRAFFSVMHDEAEREFAAAAPAQEACVPADDQALSDVLGVSTGPTVVLGPNRCVVDGNLAFWVALGGGARGVDFLDLVSPPDRDRIERELSCIAGGRCVVVRAGHPRRDGGQTEVEYRFSPLEGGRVSGVGRILEEDPSSA